MCTKWLMKPSPLQWRSLVFALEPLIMVTSTVTEGN